MVCLRILKLSLSTKKVNKSEGRLSEDSPPPVIHRSGVCYNVCMVNKHFFKILIIFIGMIIIGLLAVFFAGSGGNTVTMDNTDTSAKVDISFIVK